MARFESATPRKRFGQHFLIDNYVIDSIIDLVAPTGGDRILEIGPGEGVLTSPLVASGAHVEAVEIDRDLAARLLERFAAATNFTLHCADILKFPLTVLGPTTEGWKVVGNLPYNISTPLIIRLLEHTGTFSSLTLMVQREVAERMAASPGSGTYGRLSVMVQRRCRVTMALQIGPESFRPPPKVESTVVLLQPHPEDLDPAFESWLAELVRCAFSARRKTLSNALRPHVDQAAFARAAIDPNLRAEQLGVAEFVRLARTTRP